MKSKITKRMLDKAEFAVYTYIDERRPADALPGGTQVFADNELDVEYKHEAGCRELAKRVLEAVLSRAGTKK